MLNCGFIQPHWDKQVDFELSVEGNYRRSNCGSLRRVAAAGMVTACGAHFCFVEGNVVLAKKIILPARKKFCF